MKIRRVCGLIIICVCLLMVGCGKKSEDDLANGNYKANVTMEGGSGKASIASPADVKVEDGKIYVTICWSSPNYDYMIVDGEKYMNEAESGANSTFTFAISGFDQEIDVIADTTAMSVPHEIEYKLRFELQSYSSLEKTGSMELLYANEYKVDFYAPYTLITIEDDEYLLVPEGYNPPQDVPESVTVLRQPLDDTYLVSTSAMDFFSELDAMDYITLTSDTEDEWYIDSAKEAMAEGDMVYAGKYNAPDYELLLQKECKFAIENTMIYHNPEAKEKLEELGIPVLVERSSYETHPLGRLEWIKLYGVLYDKIDEATSFYDEQIEKLEPVLTKENTGKTVAFFYVNSTGAVNVRKPNDYVSKMIEMAGGSYILKDYIDDSDNALSTMNMQFEDFYQYAKDADIIIYNSAIEGEIESREDLLAKNELFADFKAYKEGNVYCAGGNFFQEVTGTCDFIENLNEILNDPDVRQTRFIKRVD